jgi:ABC-type lipoprotein release transport system permease subunit
VDGELEAPINPLFKHVVAGKPLAEYRSPRRALVGAALAQELDLEVGRKFVCMVQGADGELRSELLRVGGLVRSGIEDLDKSLVMVRLGFAQKMAQREGQVHELAVFLRSHDEVRRVEPTIERLIAGRRDIEAVGWDVAMPNLADAIKMDYSGLRVIVLILYFIVAIGIVNTLLMSVMERTRQFGVLKALGARPRRIVQMVVAEATVMGLLSAVAGTVLSLPATWALVEWGLDLRAFMSNEFEFGGVAFSLEMHAVWAVEQMVGLAVAIVVLFVVGSLYPAVRAGRVVPVDSLRFT